MDMQAFARSVVEAAESNGNILILPIGQRDRNNGCILRFRLGSL